jgi:hypothetical protein
MILPDLHPPAIISTVTSPAPAIASAPAISADIRAIQSWRDRELEFAAIRKFGENWDGYRSAAPTAAALDAAAIFLAICKRDDPGNPPARIALSPSGFLSADWLDGDALVRAEIMELASNEIEWMRAIPGRPTEFVTTALMDRKVYRTEQVQTWQPAEVAEGELALAFAL